MAENTEQQNAFMSEGTKRTRGRDAQRMNILIARAVAQAVKSTLGPKGMDKMIVDELIKIGIIPSNKEHGYILRKLLRKCWKNDIIVDHRFYKEECDRQTKNLERYSWSIYLSC